ncbi:MAG: hypothetical protein FJX74_16415 [Armatimonadetes bacterium]|nr:hypothetical protein [Armatimonadota bacterium]
MPTIERSLRLLAEIIPTLRKETDQDEPFTLDGLVQRRDAEGIASFLATRVPEVDWRRCQPIVRCSRRFEHEGSHGDLGAFRGGQDDRAALFPSRGLLLSSTFMGHEGEWYGGPCGGSGPKSVYVQVWALRPFRGEPSFLVAKCIEETTTTRPVEDGVLFEDTYDQTDHVLLSGADEGDNTDRLRGLFERCITRNSML